MAVTARERSFSTAGCTVTARQTALSAENVDNINSCLLIPLKFNVRNIDTGRTSQFDYRALQVATLFDD